MNRLKRKRIQRETQIGWPRQCKHPVTCPMPDRCMACLGAATAVRAMVYHGIWHDSPRSGMPLRGLSRQPRGIPWRATGRAPYTMPWYPMACHDVGFRHRPGPTGHGRAEPPAQGHQAEARETEEIDNQNAEGSKASDRQACQVKLTSTNIETEKIS